MLLRLPFELQIDILQRLCVEDIFQVGSTSKELRKITRTCPDVWRFVEFQKAPSTPSMFETVMGLSRGFLTHLDVSTCDSILVMYSMIPTLVRCERTQLQQFQYTPEQVLSRGVDASGNIIKLVLRDTIDSCDVKKLFDRFENTLERMIVQVEGYAEHVSFLFSKYTKQLVVKALLILQPDPEAMSTGRQTRKTWKTLSDYFSSVHPSSCILEGFSGWVPTHTLEGVQFLDAVSKSRKIKCLDIKQTNQYTDGFPFTLVGEWNEFNEWFFRTFWATRTLTHMSYEPWDCAFTNLDDTNYLSDEFLRGFSSLVYIGVHDENQEEPTYLAEPFNNAFIYVRGMLGRNLCEQHCHQAFPDLFRTGFVGILNKYPDFPDSKELTDLKLFYWERETIG